MSQEVLDPSVGEGVVAAMQREVHRMELRKAELLRRQEKLMQASGGHRSGGPLATSVRACVSLAPCVRVCSRAIACQQSPTWPLDAR